MSLTLIGLDTLRGITAHEAHLVEVVARQKELNSEADGQTFNDVQQAEWEGLVERRKKVESAVTELRAREAYITGAALDEKRTEQPIEQRVRPTMKAPADIFDLAAYRQRAQSVDDLPEMYIEGARKAVGEVLGLSSKSKERITDLLRDIDEPGTLARRILAVGSPLYKRAFGKKVMGGYLSQDEERALATYTNSGADGGYAVPIELDPTLILTSTTYKNPLRAISRVETITGKEWNGVTSGAVTVSRVAENTAVTENSPTLTQPRAIPTSVKGLIKFSIEVDQDWNSLQSEMGRLLADAKAVEESDSFVDGRGNGLTAPEGIDNLADTSIVWTQATGNFGPEDIYALETDPSGGNGLPDRYRERASFIGNKSIYHRIRQMSIGTVGEGAIWVRGLAVGNPPELIAYPAYEASAMDATVTNGNDILILGDFNHFLIVDRVGMSIELIPHLFDGDGKPTGSRGLWAMWRNTSLILVDDAFRKLRVGEGS